MAKKPIYQNSGSFVANRSLEINRENDNVKDVTVGYIDIDNAIKYYFDNVIKPYVEEDNAQVPVPVIMGSPERWKSVQKDGFFRDKNGLLTCPLIMFRRTSMEKKRGITRNLDANNPRVFQTFERYYTPRNNYDKFSILTGGRPQRELHNIVVPDYMQISYECIIWADYMVQMNKLQEAINYAESSYWGERDKFNFYAVVNSMDNAVEVSDGTERIVKTTFNLTIHGYIIADTVQKEVSQYSKRNFSLSRISFGTEGFISAATGNAVQASVSSAGGNSSNGSSQLMTNNLTYLRANSTKTATTVTAPDTATFTSVGILAAPAGMPATSVNDFSFFVNGQYIPPTAIVSFAESGANCVLIVNTATLGFTLTSDDIVSAFGKFE